MLRRPATTESIAPVVRSPVFLAAPLLLLCLVTAVYPGTAASQQPAAFAPVVAVEPSQVVAPVAVPTDPAWFERDVWREGDRGFHYYPPDAKPPAPAKPKKRELKAITDIEELQAEVKRLRSAAVMDPTEPNMKAYLEANTLMLAKSAMFADVWKRTVWTNPEFDYRAVQPTANFAVNDLKNARNDAKASWLRSIAKDFGLVFFFRSDCPYCKLQAPILQMMATSYGVEVLPISMDGGPLEGFPNAKPDNGISMRLSQGRGITMVPTLYLVSRETREAVLLGAGIMAIDEIIERVHVLTRLKPGEGLGGGAEAALGGNVTGIYAAAQRTGAR